MAKVMTQEQARSYTEIWDAKPLYEKLQELAFQLDSALQCSPSGIEEWADAETVIDVSNDLEREAERLFDWCKERGLTP